jgi:coenzyme F420-dependent glucose-6-phosphate dehydrogenase
MTTKFGLTLSSEEHPPRRLVELARLAESTGFDFVSISDHFHPWLDEQGHSPFVWTVLGAVAASTERIEVGVGVTCPIMRIHPAILAQATATTSLLLGERFVWGVGTGEALNEHILGDRWPPADLRLERLDEAIGLIRELWTGREVTHRGKHFVVENARIYDIPERVPPIVVSAFGPKAAQVAARCGDGLWMSTPSAETVERFHEAGGRGPVYAQLSVCFAEDESDARRTAHRVWRTTSVPGELNQELPTPAFFEQASSSVTEEDVASAVPCGPDPRPVIEMARQAVEAGADHVYFHQIGPDQEGFCRFWTERVAPELVGVPSG